MRLQSFWYDHCSDPAACCHHGVYNDCYSRVLSSIMCDCIQLSLEFPPLRGLNPASLFRRMMNQAISGISWTPGSAVTTLVMQIRIARHKSPAGRPSWLKQGSTHPRALLHYCRRCLQVANILHGWRPSPQWQLKLTRNPRCCTCESNCKLSPISSCQVSSGLCIRRKILSNVGVTRGAKHY